MERPLPIRVTTGRVSFVDPDNLVYVPFRPTAADANAALAEVKRHGILRPLPGARLSYERVYPIDFFPTDDPHRWHVFFRNDQAELIECTLHEHYDRERTTPGPWDDTKQPEYIDPFSV